jgi:hypothetical protein
MLDNLRDDDYSRPFFEDDTPLEQAAGPAAAPVQSRRSTQFLGMTPFQRFVLSVMLMMVVCLLGSLLLLATGRVGLYF